MSAADGQIGCLLAFQYSAGVTVDLAVCVHKANAITYQARRPRHILEIGRNVQITGLGDRGPAASLKGVLWPALKGPRDATAGGPRPPLEHGTL